MASELTENEKFFQEHGYYPTTYVPPKKVLAQTPVDHSDPESYFGPFVWSLKSGSFHHPDCKWAKEIHKLDKIYGSRAEAIRAGKKPCKYSCKS